MIYIYYYHDKIIENHNPMATLHKNKIYICIKIYYIVVLYVILI